MHLCRRMHMIDYCVSKDSLWVWHTTILSSHSIVINTCLSLESCFVIGILLFALSNTLVWTEGRHMLQQVHKLGRWDRWEDGMFPKYETITHWLTKVVVIAKLLMGIAHIVLTLTFEKWKMWSCLSDVKKQLLTRITRNFWWLQL